MTPTKAALASLSATLAVGLAVLGGAWVADTPRREEQQLQQDTTARLQRVWNDLDVEERIAFCARWDISRQSILDEIRPGPDGPPYSEEAMLAFFERECG